LYIYPPLDDTHTPTVHDPHDPPTLNMKFTTLPCLLAALYSTTHVLANAIEDRAPAATPAPELVANDPQPQLE